MSDSWDPMEYSPSGSSLHGMLQVIILEWLTISFSSGSSLPRDWASIFCIGRRVLYHWATREALTQKLTLCLSSCMFYSTVYWLFCWTDRHLLVRTPTIFIWRIKRQKIQFNLTPAPLLKPWWLEKLDSTPPYFPLLTATHPVIVRVGSWPWCT